MAAQWERWLKYARAMLDDTVKRGHDEMDRREADLEARQKERTPWKADHAGDAPTFEEAKARIEHKAAEAERATADAPPAADGPQAADAPPAADGPQADAAPTSPTAPPPLATDPGLGTMDFAAQKRAADERLAAMRKELGLDGGPPPDDDPPG